MNTASPRTTRTFDNEPPLESSSQNSFQSRFRSRRAADPSASSPRKTSSLSRFGSALTPRRSPPPLLAKPGVTSCKSGVQHVSSSSNAHHDAVAAKMATFDNPASSSSPLLSQSPSSSRPGVTHVTHSQEDALAAKIAASRPKPQDNNGTLNNNNDNEPRIEIAPGVTARLRGANETMACIENDFYFPTQCLACTMDICVIMDANYVLCPICKSVSPREGCEDGGTDGGVGLGFTFDDLQKWQYEILLRQKQGGYP